MANSCLMGLSIGTLSAIPSGIEDIQEAKGKDGCGRVWLFISGVVKCIPVLGGLIFLIIAIVKSCLPVASELTPPRPPSLHSSPPPSAPSSHASPAPIPSPSIISSDHSRGSPLPAPEGRKNALTFYVIDLLRDYMEGIEARPDVEDTTSGFFEFYSFVATLQDMLDSFSSRTLQDLDIVTFANKREAFETTIKPHLALSDEKTMEIIFEIFELGFEDIDSPEVQKRLDELVIELPSFGDEGSSCGFDDDSDFE